MKKTLPIIIVVLIIAGLGLWWQFGVKNSVTNFEECVAAGNPVMEIYPRQCRAGDKLFTEDVQPVGNDAISVTNFEECVAAGNPVMEIYPRQCRAGDKLFTEDVQPVGNDDI